MPRDKKVDLHKLVNKNYLVRHKNSVGVPSFKNYSISKEQRQNPGWLLGEKQSSASKDNRMK